MDPPNVPIFSDISLSHIAQVLLPSVSILTSYRKVEQDPLLKGKVTISKVMNNVARCCYWVQLVNRIKRKKKCLKCQSLTTFTCLSNKKHIRIKIILPNLEKKKARKGAIVLFWWNWASLHLMAKWTHRGEEEGHFRRYRRDILVKGSNSYW